MVVTMQAYNNMCVDITCRAQDEDETSLRLVTEMEYERKERSRSSNKGLIYYIKNRVPPMYPRLYINYCRKPGIPNGFIAV